MSPEQLEGKALDGRSDLFSVAIVLAELLMSKRLFSASNPLEVLLMVRNVDLSRLEKNGSHIDPQLLFILSKGLQRNRDERYLSATAFRDDLVQWLSARKQRTNAATLKKYVAELEEGGFISPPKAGEATSSMTMSGTNTKERYRKAKGAAVLGQQVFELGPSGGAEPTSVSAAGVTSVSDRPALMRAMNKIAKPAGNKPAGNKLASNKPATAQEALELGHGDLSTLLPMDLIGAISVSSRSGLLTLERDAIVKEAFFVSGDPVFVSSNDPNELFGNFLVLRGLITAEELESALGAMPHFGGRLGQTLVGLRLLKPVDAINLLAEQVSEKLLRTCCWDYGSFKWEPDKRNPHTSVSLHLSSTKIVAQGVRSLAPHRLQAWIEPRLSQAPSFAKSAPFEAYEFGPALSALLATMDGGRTIEEMLASVSPQSQRVVSAAIFALSVTH